MRFIKMHALGNDFIVLPNTTKDYAVAMIDFLKLSDRHKGVGFDQAICLEPIGETQKDKFIISFFNADGSMAGGCGNGTRAIAGYIHQQTQLNEFDILISLPSGGHDTVYASIKENNTVCIKMPSPRFLASEIPLADKTLDAGTITLPYFDGIGFCVNIGNPHIVYIVNDISTIDITRIGSLIEHDSLFPERINVEFIEIINSYTIKMRVWERGAGITQACGTGACASVIVAHKKGFLDKSQPTKVILDGGMLEISYDMSSDQLLMTGDYHFVYEGETL
jgi:diaminopimelate epimerase